MDKMPFWQGAALQRYLFQLNIALQDLKPQQQPHALCALPQIQDDISDFLSVAIYLY